MKLKCLRRPDFFLLFLHSYLTDLLASVNEKYGFLLFFSNRDPHRQPEKNNKNNLHLLQIFPNQTGDKAFHNIRMIALRDAAERWRSGCSHNANMQPQLWEYRCLPDLRLQICAE